jgi:hypothetical protein
LQTFYDTVVIAALATLGRDTKVSTKKTNPTSRQSLIFIELAPLNLSNIFGFGLELKLIYSFPYPYLYRIFLAPRALNNRSTTYQIGY